MRQTLSIIAAVGLTMASAGAAQADTYPTRPIKLIVPFAAGGNGDVIARVTGRYMEKRLGVAVVVENRPGAGGIIGTNAVAKSAPDGYTLCVCSTGPISVAPWTDDLTYDPVKDLQPVSMISTNALVLVVRPDLEVKTTKELIELSKKREKGLTYSNVGAAGLVTYSAEIFAAETGAKFVSVPYRGGALATAAVAAGEVDLSFANMSDVISQMKSNRVRPLAVTTPKRTPFTPDTPTFVEEGVMKYPIESWNAMFAPVGIEPAILDKLSSVLADMAKDPEVEKAMANLGSTPVSNSPAEFAKQIKLETEQWGKGLEASGIKKRK